MVSSSGGKSTSSTSHPAVSSPSGTFSFSTPSSSSDYMTGEADDSSDSKAVIPFSLKSVETVLSLSKV